MIRKVRDGFLWMGILFAIQPICAQYYDTFPRHGFVTANEAGDSLFTRLVSKKLQTVKEFTIDYQTFTKETRKVDSIIPEQMVRGQYVAYWGKVDRGYKKVWKRLKKRGITAKKAVRDTLLVYKNYGNDVVKVELYIVQKKYKAYVKFQMWQVDGLWYLTGKMELVEESVPSKK